MKYAVLICGAMADRTMPEYNNITPLSSADKACLDELAKYSEVGLVKTAEAADKYSVEKSVLSLLGYDPKIYFKGSAVLYSSSMGLIPEKDDVIFRCSFVKLSDNEIYEEKTMLSEVAPNAELDDIFRELCANFNNNVFRFVRKDDNIFLIWKKGEFYAGDFAVPQEALSECIAYHLPRGDFAQPIYNIMKKSCDVLKNYSADYVWIWGESAVYDMESFRDRFGLSCCVVTDKDFVRGMAGYMKAETASCGENASEIILEKLKENDIVFLYNSNAYEYSLSGDFEMKTKVISDFDKNIVRPVFEGLKSSGEDFGLMAVSDIAVPVHLKRLSGDPVPYLIYRSFDKKNSSISGFDENTAADSDNYVSEPSDLIKRLISLP